MHVAINACFLRPPMGGLETYLRELVPALRRVRPGLEVTVLTSRAAAPTLADAGWPDDVAVVVPRGLERSPSTALYELGALNAVARAKDVDVVHSLALTGPLLGRGRPRHVDTIADTTWFEVDDPEHEATYRLWRTVVPPVARRAARVIAISEDAARGVERHCGVPRERIDLTPLGLGSPARATPTPTAALRARLAIPPGPIVLTVAAKKAHKNLLAVVRALPDVPHAVAVMPGRATAYEAEVRAEAERLGVAGRLVLPDYVDAADLEGLYAAASAFVLPSFHEGFGLPILEAMARGVPTVVSDVSALPEVAGDAALRFDPHQPHELASGLARLLADDELRTDLAARGRRRAGQFTWEACAEATLASYERALAAPSRRASAAATA